jgi:Protein of unknown function (DUF4038)/Putative collagen-binding domain of a collagenase
MPVGHQRTPRDGTLAALAAVETLTEQTERQPLFPVKAAPGGRYLTYADGHTPFLLLGDTPHSMLIRASLSDMETYISTRQQQGFTVLWVLFIDATYSNGYADGSNYNGDRPFTSGSSPSDYDLSTPNEAYWAYADEMVDLASRYDMLIGVDGLENGNWMTTFNNNGSTNVYNFGAFLGARYGKYRNVVWFTGNDFQTWSSVPSDATLVNHFIDGIRSADPIGHLHTIELDYNVSTSLDSSTLAANIDINGVYTYYIIYDEMRYGYAQAAKPAVLIESNFEGENNTGNDPDTNLRNRKQIWWTMTNGGAGQFFGSRPAYRFDSGWQSAMATAETVQFLYQRNLLAGRPWHRLVPDTGNTFLTAGEGTYGSSTDWLHTSTYATAAVTALGDFGLVYSPASRTLTIDMSKMAGSTTARWWDPTDNSFSAISGSPFSNSGTHNFATPGTNAGGDGDWLLVLEA